MFSVTWDGGRCLRIKRFKGIESSLGSLGNNLASIMRKLETISIELKNIDNVQKITWRTKLIIFE